jgi:hypothetical protein
MGWFKKKKPEDREYFYKALLSLFRNIELEELNSLYSKEELSEYEKGRRDVLKENIDLIDSMLNPSVIINLADSKQKY